MQERTPAAFKVFDLGCKTTFATQSVISRHWQCLALRVSAAGLMQFFLTLARSAFAFAGLRAPTPPGAVVIWLKPKG
jgi:hypothetical protein